MYIQINPELIIANFEKPIGLSDLIKVIIPDKHKKQTVKSLLRA